MQLPYYLVHAFNADTRFTDLFAKQWRAEWAFYNSSLLNAGEQGRYGAGAGPTAAWCAGVGYKADLISSVPNAQTCRALGPGVLVGVGEPSPPRAPNRPNAPRRIRAGRGPLQNRI